LISHLPEKADVRYAILRHEGSTVIYSAFGRLASFGSRAGEHLPYEGVLQVMSYGKANKWVLEGWIQRVGNARMDFGK
jgi:hypothetical protein